MVGEDAGLLVASGVVELEAEVGRGGSSVPVAEGEGSCPDMVLRLVRCYLETLYVSEILTGKSDCFPWLSLPEIAMPKKQPERY